MDGGLTARWGRPGDLVTLRTDNHGAPSVYAVLESGPPIPVYLIAAPGWGSTTCGDPAAYALGGLVWSDGVGTLTFRVPAAEPGIYFLALYVQGACWRTGSAAGPLALEVLARADPAGPPVGWLVAMGGAAVLAGAVGRLAAKRRSNRAEGRWSPPGPRARVIRMPRRTRGPQGT